MPDRTVERAAAVDIASHLEAVLAKNVVERLASWMDVEALRAIANGLDISLDTLEAAKASARDLNAALPTAEVAAEFDARMDKHKIGRAHV